MTERPPSVLLELHSADRLVRTVVVEAFLRRGLHPSLFAILSLIAVHEPVTPSQLARETGVRPTTLRDMVREMTAAGHVRRLDNPGDRRSHFLATTSAGKRFLRRADAIVYEVEQELERELGGGLEELRPPLRRLRRAAQAVWDAPSSGT
jgi:DNA-binding MarR family transcriptional regulator